MSNAIRPGSYTAKIRDYYVDKTHNGAPRINIAFDVRIDLSNPSVVRQLKWSGSLSSPNSRDLVLKTLAICGLSSPSMLGAVAKGRAGGALNLFNDLRVEVVSEERETKDNPPKKYTWTYVKYINAIDGLANKDLMAYDDFDAFVNNTGLIDDFSRLTNNQQQQQQYTEADPPPQDDPAIPF